MILPEKKEREYRFRLALRMGFPIFSLFSLLIYSKFIQNSQTLDASFYIEVILLIVFCVYFIFYIIYDGFDTKITDSVSKTFTREYLYKFLKKELQKYNKYSLVLISIDNLSDINNRYGIKNGDKVIKKVSEWIVEYFIDKDIQNFPIGHIKGGDFVIGLKGEKENYTTVLELMCLKSEDFVVDDIEIKITGAMTDTKFSNKLDYLIENLFEIQQINRTQKLLTQNSDEIGPDKLESFVIKAVKNRDFIILSQKVLSLKDEDIQEYFVKLKTPHGGVIYQKAYVKVLDRLNLMVDFDLMVLEESILRYDKNSKEIFALNISPTSLRNKLFISKAKELIASKEYIKGKIIFLLSEIQYYSQIKKYNSILKVFRDMGVFIAIDRLGSIHTSFLYLRDLDIDIVRFDSYYSKDANFEKYRNVIDGFNTMAHDKSVKTWLKMIESQEIKSKAKEMKIDYLQGKLIFDLEKKYEN